MDNMKSVIEVTDLIKKYKKFELNIPNLQIPEGFATALIGENGAGKSTLLQCLAGVIRSYEGNVSFFGGETEEEVVRNSIGYVSQTDYFLDDWKLSQVKSVSKLIYNNFDEQKFDALLEDLAIKTGEGSREMNQKIKDMSGGNQMKTALAAVFARDVDLMILDEPASALDPLMRDKLNDMIRAFLDTPDGSHTVFFSTHNIADMESVTDYAIILENGQVVEQGFVEDLKEIYRKISGEDASMLSDAQKQLMYDYQQTPYGFTGICRLQHLNAYEGISLTEQTPTLFEISVAVMKQFTRMGGTK